MTVIDHCEGDGCATTPDAPVQRQALPPCLSCQLAPTFHSGKVPHSEAPRYTEKGKTAKRKHLIKHLKGTQ